MRAVALIMTLMLSMQSGFAQVERREITVANACQQPIRILVVLADRPNDWRTFGWYTIHPGAGPTTLSSQGVRLGHLTNHNLFFYAEGLNFRQIWEGGDHYTNFGGVRYGLRRANTVMSEGRLSFRLC